MVLVGDYSIETVQILKWELPPSILSRWYKFYESIPVHSSVYSEEAVADGLKNVAQHHIRSEAGAFGKQHGKHSNLNFWNI